MKRRARVKLGSRQLSADQIALPQVMLRWIKVVRVSNEDLIGLLAVKRRKTWMMKNILA